MDAGRSIHRKQLGINDFLLILAVRTCAAVLRTAALDDRHSDDRGQGTSYPDECKNDDVWYLNLAKLGRYPRQWTRVFHSDLVRGPAIKRLILILLYRRSLLRSEAPEKVSEDRDRTRVDLLGLNWCLINRQYDDI